MNTLITTEQFDSWMHGLKDRAGRARIAARIIRAEYGNFGDCESVGGGICEMRIHSGPGYRIYFTQRSGVIYLLLCAGDKSTQQSDIRRATSILKTIQDANSHDST